MTRLYVYALLTALLFGYSAAEPVDSNAELTEIVRALQNEIKTIELNAQSDLRETKERIGRLEAENKVLREDKYTLNTKLESVEWWINDRQMDANTMVLATLSAFENSIVDEGPIVWDSAVINPGGHFDTILGMYTAPVNGYYQFSVTKQGNNYHGGFWFLVDEVRYAVKEAYFYNSDDTPAGSATINIKLTAGQIIRVQNCDSTIVYGTDSFGVIRSWFTGHLLYAL